MANAAQINAFFKTQGWQENALGWQQGGWTAYIADGQLCFLPPLAKRLARKPQGLGLVIYFALGSIKIAAGQLCLPAAIGRYNFNLWASGQKARLAGA